MTKNLTFVDDYNIVKYQDSTASLNFILSENETPFDVTRIDSLTAKIGNENGVITDIDLDVNNLTQDQINNGSVTLKMTDNIMKMLPPDQYNVELWASINPISYVEDVDSVEVTIHNDLLKNEQAIFPSEGYLTFLVSDNLKAKTGNIMNAYPIDQALNTINSWKNTVTDRVLVQLTNLLENEIRHWQGDISQELKNELVAELIEKSNEIKNTIQNVLGHSLEDELFKQAGDIKTKLSEQVRNEMIQEVADRLKDLTPDLISNVHDKVSSEFQKEFNDWKQSTNDSLFNKLATDIVDKTNVMKNEISTDMKNILDNYFKEYVDNTNKDLQDYKDRIDTDFNNFKDNITNIYSTYQKDTNNDINTFKDNVNTNFNTYKDSTTTNLNNKLNEITSNSENHLLQVIQDKFTDEDSQVRKDLSEQVQTTMSKLVTDTLHNMQLNGSIAVSKQDFDDFENKINNYVDSLKIASNVNEIIDNIKKDVADNRQELLDKINVLSENKADKQDVDNRLNSIDLSSAVNESKTYTDTKVNKISSETQDGMNNINNNLGNKLDQLLDVDKIKADVNSRVDNLDNTKADKSELSNLQNNVNTSLNNKADKSDVEDKIKNVDVSSAINQVKDYSNMRMDNLSNNFDNKLNTLQSQVMNDVNDRNSPSAVLGNVDDLVTGNKNSIVGSINEIAKHVNYFMPLDFRTSQILPPTNISDTNQYLIYNATQNDIDKLNIMNKYYKINAMSILNSSLNNNVNGKPLTGLKFVFGFKYHLFKNNTQSALTEVGDYNTQISNPIIVGVEDLLKDEGFDVDFAGNGMNLNGVIKESPKLRIKYNKDLTFDIQSIHGRENNKDGSELYYIYPYIKQIATYTYNDVKLQDIPMGTNIIDNSKTLNGYYRRHPDFVNEYFSSNNTSYSRSVSIYKELLDNGYNVNIKNLNGIIVKGTIYNYYLTSELDLRYMNTSSNMNATNRDNMVDFSIQIPKTEFVDVNDSFHKTGWFNFNAEMTLHNEPGWPTSTSKGTAVIQLSYDFPNNDISSLTIDVASGLLATASYGYQFYTINTFGSLPKGDTSRIQRMISDYNSRQQVSQSSSNTGTSGLSFWNTSNIINDLRIEPY